MKPKYLVERWADGSIAFVRVCYTEEQVDRYLKEYLLQGRVISIELENPLRGVMNEA